MGGGSSSLSKANIYSSNVVNAMVKSIQNCQSNTKINQTITINGNFNVVNKVRMYQGVKLSSSCILNSENMASLQQNVANAIKENSDAQSVALLGALGKSDSKNITLS